MIRSFHVENFKSITELDVELGRVTVLIGENGCGKSNILEAIAFAGAAASDKADNEFLASRGVRVPEPEMVRSAFETSADTNEISIALMGGPAAQRLEFKCIFDATSQRWSARGSTLTFSGFSPDVRTNVAAVLGLPESNALSIMRASFRAFFDDLSAFLIFSPENSALRTFQAEGQILPLGIRGEGLFSLLKKLSKSDDGVRVLERLSDQLSLIDWFQRFEVDKHLAPGERTLNIADRFLDEKIVFDQRSANEGFLFLLFYFALMLAPGTPKFFAIDNVDASLNPHLCAELTRRLVALAKSEDKQLVLTTHNPAVLDGLDLHDDEQRLLVVHRNRQGHTKARRVEAPKPADGQPTVRLSEAFLRGDLGGLPKHF